MRDKKEPHYRIKTQQSNVLLLLVVQEHRQPKATSLLDKLGQFLGLDGGDEDDAMTHLQKELQSI